MATTVFSNGVTLTDAGWFNDVDAITYDGATTQILVGGGAGSVAVWTTATGTGSPVRAGSPTLTGTVAAAALTLSGNFTIATNKFTVAAATGNTVAAGTVQFSAFTAATFVAGDKYLVVDASGNIHVSALGPAS